MALVRKSEGRQYPLVGEFTVNIGTDTVVNTAGATVPANEAGSTLVAAIPLPPGATVLSGALVVNAASNDAGTATIEVGDSGNAARYLGATSIKATGLTPLVPTGYVGNGEDVLLTIANGTGGATAGSVTVRIVYSIYGRAQEVQSS